MDCWRIDTDSSYNLFASFSHQSNEAWSFNSNLAGIAGTNGYIFITSYITLRKSVHFFIINLLAFTILFLIVGVLGFHWYLEEIAALFLALGITTGFTMGYSTTTLTKSFISGVKDIVSASLVVGFAGGIIAILNNGQIIDTILNSLSAGLENTGKFSAVSVMYVFVSALNLIITSGSAKAALTIPIMTDFSDIIGLSRQAMITAFQFGTGFTEMIAPHQAC